MADWQIHNIKKAKKKDTRGVHFFVSHCQWYFLCEYVTLLLVSFALQSLRLRRTMKPFGIVVVRHCINVETTQSTTAQEEKKKRKKKSDTKHSACGKLFYNTTKLLLEVAFATMRIQKRVIHQFPVAFACSCQWVLFVLFFTLTHLNRGSLSGVSKKRVYILSRRHSTLVVVP